METDDEGTPLSYYVYGNGLISKEDVVSEEISIYHYDRRGSTIALTDIEGLVTHTYEYDVYGELSSFTGTTENIFKYSGKYGVQTDSNGLYYMRARYYNPEIKRFINRDIVVGDISESQTFNRYVYVNGNPVSYIDPFGLSKFSDGYDFASGFEDIFTECGWLCAPADFLFVGDTFVLVDDWLNDELNVGQLSGSLAFNYTIGKGIKSFNIIRDTSKSAGRFLRGESGHIGKNPLLGNNEVDLPGRSGAFRQAKRDAGIPVSQHPDSMTKVNMTGPEYSGGHVIKDANGKVISTREYTFTNKDGTKVIIQDHSAGHNYQVGGQGSHFNVRVFGEDNRNRNFPGTKDHYPFNN